MRPEVWFPLNPTPVHEPLGNPLNRPPGTFSPSGGEGEDEAVRFMESEPAIAAAGKVTK